MELHTPKFGRNLRWNAWLLLLRLQLRSENHRDPFIRYIRKLPKSEKRKRMRAAAVHVPPLTRMVFLAHHLDGLTYPEIAARSGLSVREIEREIARILFAELDAFWNQYTDGCAIDGNA